MQIADKPAPLGVAGLDDPETRRTQLLQLKPGLGLETLILKRQPGRRGHLLGQRRLSEPPRAVRQKRYLLPGAAPRRGALRPARPPAERARSGCAGPAPRPKRRPATGRTARPPLRARAG